MASPNDPSDGLLPASVRTDPAPPDDRQPIEADTDLQRLQLLPWTRVITAVPGGYHARVRELPHCSANGSTPSDALARLEAALTERLLEGACGEADLPSPNYWDRSVTEFVPVAMPRSLLDRAQAVADHRGLSLGSYIEQTVRATIETGTPEPTARVQRRQHKRAGPPDSTEPKRDTADPESRLLDRIIFPEAESSADHWQRVVLDQAIGAHLAELGPAKLTAAEISGNTHAHLPWRSYTNLDFPDFDLCAPLEGQGPFDVVVCEQVLEHVSDPQTAVANLRKLTRPGGHVVVSTPFLIRVHELPQYGMRDYWRFTPRGLATLLEGAGLVVDEVGDWGNRWCVLGNLEHWASFRRWHSLRREPDVPVQVWAFARNPDAASTP